MGDSLGKAGGQMRRFQLRGVKQELSGEHSGSGKRKSQDRGGVDVLVLRDLAFVDEAERQRSCRRVISSSETRVSHSSTRPDGPRCHHVEMFFGSGFADCSTMVHTTFFFGK